MLISRYVVIGLGNVDSSDQFCKFQVVHSPRYDSSKPVSDGGMFVNPFHQVPSSVASVITLKFD